jgi:hypothetical protein
VAVVRAAWTSSSFLLYAGGLLVLFSTAWFLTRLGDDYGDASFVGWSLLVLVFLLTCALSFRAGRRPVAAGLLALSSVIAFAVFAGALEEWFGWLPDNLDSLFDGFHLGLFLLELLTLAAAFVALRVFRFPLLVAVAVFVGWYFFTDLLSGGGSWSAIVTIVFGLLLLAVAAAVDPAYGLWIHVGAGVTIGGALLWFWHTTDVDWILVALAAVVYIALGPAIERSSWVVLGALGLLLSWSHFVEKWFGSANLFFPFTGGFAFEENGSDHPVAAALSYGVLGFLFILLGIVIGARRQRRDLAAAPLT